MSSSFAEITYDALLVDDEPALRQALARAFRGAGFRCDLAANGRQASEMLSDRRYHVVVTDLSMPELNGHRLAVELLDQPDRPVVVVVTGVTQPKLERDLRLRGVDDILFKPVDYSQLIARTRELIQERVARQADCAMDKGGAQLKGVPEAKISQSQAIAKEICANIASPLIISADAKASEQISVTGKSERKSIGIHVVLPGEISQDPKSVASLVSPRIEQLERELLALSQRRHYYWLWPAITLAIGVSLGWFLAILGK